MTFRFRRSFDRPFYRTAYRMMLAVATLFVGAISVVAAISAGEDNPAPVNNLPNPYHLVPGWAKIPAGRIIGSSASIYADRDGKSIWVVDRCGGNSCVGSTLDPVMKFDESGNLMKSFGAGMFSFPHGLYVDKGGNVWVPDGQARGEKTNGQQVIKFSPDGKVLMKLGTQGVPGNDQSHFNQPCDVIVAPNGDIFVADGHNGQNPDSPPDSNARVLKYTSDGKFIKSWGKLGSGLGEFRTPHNLAFDSKGRLFVADRGNNRIQIFDQDGNFIAQWKQFSRPSGLYIGKHDVLYVSDSETNTMNHPGGWKRGVRIGSAKDGKVRDFIPQQPEPAPDAIPSGQEGITADAAGNVFGSNVYLPGFVKDGPPGEIKKYSK
jgi:sugar lactone lactonase YvrE